MRREIETHAGGLHAWIEWFSHFVTGCPLETMGYVFKRGDDGKVDRSTVHAFKCPCGRMWSKTEIYEKDVDEAKGRAKERYCESGSKDP